MPRRANKHIKKYNQLVDVYEPEDIEPLEPISSAASSNLVDRKEEAISVRDRVEDLSTTDFFDEDDQAEMNSDESLPAPAEAATSQKQDMLDRLGEIESALEDAITGDELLDTGDDLGF